MKETIKKWVIFWLSAWLTMLVIWATYAAWVWLTAWNWDTLDSSKWNALVARTEPTTFSCLYNSTWITWWNNITWTSALCWWTYKPQDFIYCNYSSTRVDWSWVQRALFRLTQSGWRIYAADTQSVIFEARYMCWN